MQSITPDELHRLQQAGEVVILDVRSPAEFAQGHARGAINLPLHMLCASAMPAAAVGRPVYLICKSGGRSAMALQRLQAEGLCQGVNVSGGTDAWMRAGLPVELGGGPIPG